MVDPKQVMVLKLSSGEEIVCEVVSTTIMDYMVKNPLRVVMVPAKAANMPPQVGLAPFSPYIPWNDGVSIKANQVIFVAPAISDLAEEYSAVFSSVLTPPKKSLII
jgi:hypothetical protein